MYNIYSNINIYACIHYIQFLYVCSIFNSKDNNNHCNNYFTECFLLFYTFVAALYILSFLIIIN